MTENIEQVIAELPDDAEFTIRQLSKMIGVGDGYIRQEMIYNRLPKRKKEGWRDLYLLGSDIKDWWKSRPGPGGRWPEGKRARRRKDTTSPVGKRGRKAKGKVDGEK